MKWNGMEKEEERKRKEKRKGKRTEKDKGKKVKNRKVCLLKGLGSQSRTFLSLVAFGLPFPKLKVRGLCDKYLKGFHCPHHVQTHSGAPASELTKLHNVHISLDIGQEYLPQQKTFELHHPKSCFQHELL